MCDLSWPMAHGQHRIRISKDTCCIVNKEKHGHLVQEGFFFRIYYTWFFACKHIMKTDRQIQRYRITRIFMHFSPMCSSLFLVKSVRNFCFILFLKTGRCIPYTFQLAALSLFSMPWGFQTQQAQSWFIRCTFTLTAAPGVLPQHMSN